MESCENTDQISKDFDCATERYIDTFGLSSESNRCHGFSGSDIPLCASDKECTFDIRLSSKCIECHSFSGSDIPLCASDGECVFDINLSKSVANETVERMEKIITDSGYCVEETDLNGGRVAKLVDHDLKRRIIVKLEDGDQNGDTDVNLYRDVQNGGKVAKLVVHDLKHGIVYKLEDGDQNGGIDVKLKGVDQNGGIDVKLKGVDQNGGIDAKLRDILSRACHQLGLLHRIMSIASERAHSLAQTKSRRCDYVGIGQRRQGRDHFQNEVNSHNQYGYQDRGQSRFRNECSCQVESKGQVHHNGRDQQASSPGASICLIPSPPENKMPQISKYSLKCNLKIPGEKIKLFSPDSEHAFQAVEHLKQAIELSHMSNVVAHYDLAMTYAQMEKFSESKQACQTIIKQATGRNSASQCQLYLASAYNLFGLCFAMEAEKLQEDNIKQDLMNESEVMFTQAVRVASHLAANIPELAAAATDLWNAFIMQQKRFEFESSEDSKKKLTQDYHYLEVIGNILSQDESVWENDEAMEHCLKCYLNLGDINGALLFYDMILLRRGGNGGKLAWHDSSAVQQLMIEVAKRALYQSQTSARNYAMPPDPIWKRIFQENFSTSKSTQKYDIVIVQDFEDDVYEPRSENVARCLKKILKKKLCLNIVHSHKEELPGHPVLDQKIEIISRSHVAIFILSRGCHEFESHLLTAVNLDHGDANSEAVVLGLPQSQGNNNQIHRVNYKKDRLNRQEEVKKCMSNQLRFIISACVATHTKFQKPGKMLPVCLNDIQAKDLPNVFQGQPTMYLSNRDIDLLNSAVQGDVGDETVNLVMKIITTVIDKNYN